MVLRGGVSEREFGLDVAPRMAHREPSAFSLPLLHEDNMRKSLPTSHEEKPHQKPMILDFWPPGPPDIDVCCWNHPVCGLLLQRPQRTKAGRMERITSCTSSLNVLIVLTHLQRIGGGRR